MNKLTILSCLILLISVNCLGQTKAQITPAKKSSKIIVLVKDSTNTVLDRLSSELFDLGYTIDSKDEKGKFIVTMARQSKNYGTRSIIRARINDTAIVFTSQIALSERFFTVDFSGSKNSPHREAWNELEALARKFGNRIVYSK